MIPKKIHYCWFGDAPFGELENKCLESWKNVHPDFEIVAWTNKDLPKFDNLYLKQAVQAKKWAFVSDYVRLYALLEQGGVYMDTDEELVKPLSEFMNHDLFIGSQRCGSCRGINPALIGAIPNSPIIKDFLDVYDHEVFIKEDGSLNLTTNPAYISRVLAQKYGISDTYIKKGRVKITENAWIYPYTYFCTDNSKAYAIHHYSGSWKPDYKITNKFSWKWGGCRYTVRKYKRHRDVPMPLEDGEQIIASLKTTKKSTFVLIKKKL